MTEVFDGFPQPKLLYGWLDRPSSVSGAASVFDFLAVTKWWDKRRFRSDADETALALDYATVAHDFRRAYYRTLRENGVEPHEERSEIHEQTAMFDRDEFRVGR